MMQKLVPALVGAAIGMLLFWGMTKLVQGPTATNAELRPVSVEIPMLLPVDPPQPSRTAMPDAPDSPQRPADELQTAGIRGVESSELTAGIRGVESEMVGTMVDRPGTKPGKVEGIDRPQSDGCVDREVTPRVLVAPDYPLAARREGREGAVEVEFTVDVEGRVRDAQVVGTGSEPAFGLAAVNAVQRWRFEPRTVDCQAVAARVRQQLQFKLDVDE